LMRFLLTAALAVASLSVLTYRTQRHNRATTDYRAGTGGNPGETRASRANPGCRSCDDAFSDAVGNHALCVCGAWYVRNTGRWFRADQFEIPAIPHNTRVQLFQRMNVRAERG